MGPAGLDALRDELDAERHDAAALALIDQNAPVVPYPLGRPDPETAGAGRLAWYLLRVLWWRVRSRGWRRK